MTLEQLAPPEIWITPDRRTGPEVRTQAITAFGFWHLDDPEWLAQRERDWQRLAKVCFDDTPKAERKLYQQYFMYGEEFGYIDPITLTLLTPFSSKDEFLALFNSPLLDDDERARVISRFVFSCRKGELELPWYQSHCDIIISAFFSGGYQLIKSQTYADQVKRISPFPYDWCTGFLYRIELLLEGEITWIPVLTRYNYFLSALSFVTEVDKRKRVEKLLASTLELVEEELALGNLTGQALKVAQQYIARQDDITQAWQLGAQRAEALANQSSSVSNKGVN
ncbi:hypothetical protein [Motilimonas eburnea]|uniref:hypothetical protein n=1 Tax=Motilimonas eburnea TaxID=1737488 RepID=UPI001E517D01|nr:hypothetical protein [Motilimonas eburnea]MCE2572815.1 hypothetical protein [Motilimonas eburnea]